MSVFISSQVKLVRSLLGVVRQLVGFSVASIKDVL